ncbi:MAG: Holliday junction branch migration protein RuvA [Saprospiraceae bacterium]|nr:Holliday junction branch migration protein RuvA [Saprospiraceae bacterium]
MYSHFQGKLVEKNPAYVIIECNGVGFVLNISINTYSKIKDNESCKLFAHLSVKEDSHTLYGFAEEKERRVFRHLISVSGVGTNTARMILSALSTDEAIAAIISDNVSVLKAIKGIGEKTAKRIILDLKDKIEKDDISAEIIKTKHNTNSEESLSALTMLGFGRNIAEKAVIRVVKNGGTELSVEEIIKEALKIL